MKAKFKVGDKVKGTCRCGNCGTTDGVVVKITRFGKKDSINIMRTDGTVALGYQDDEVISYDEPLNILKEML